MQPRGFIIFEAVEISQGVVASAACLYGAVRQRLKPPLSQRDRGMFSETQIHLRYQMSLDWAFRLCEGLLTMLFTRRQVEKKPPCRLRRCNQL